MTAPSPTPPGFTGPAHAIQTTETPFGLLFRRLWNEHIQAHWPILLVAVVLMTIEGAAIGGFAWLVRPLFDELFAAGSMDAAAWVAFTIAGLFMLRAVAGFVQRILVVTVGLRVVTALQQRMVGHLLALDMPVFRDNPPGTLIERVRGDTAALQGIASTVLISLGRDTITLLSLLAVMLINDWVWTLLALAGLPFLALPIFALQRYIRRTTVKARQAAANLTTRLDEMFHGVQTVKLNRLEGHEGSRFGKAIQAFLRPSIRAEMAKAGNPAMIDIIAAAGFLAVLYVGGQQIIDGEKSLGEFMSFFTALGLLFEPLRRLVNIAGQVQAAAASLDRIYAVFETKPTITAPPQPKPVTPGDIVFDDVHFSYGDAPVLQGLSFTAEAGKTTALVGASGAGKTTVFTMLTRLMDTERGTISLNGVPVTALEIDALRDAIAVVGQETALFDETIADNIALGDLTADAEAIRAAAGHASVLEFADRMPEGLGTLVGPRGSGLSGGQRQRVAIARAMLKAAPILLLDEPTSALDATSEKLVGAALDRLAAGRTTLVIAHRLSTVRHADKIVVMEAGRVVEEGTHADLLERSGAYARLHRLQVEGGT